jgi:membrane-bound lytic murein transglycosylase D
MAIFFGTALFSQSITFCGKPIPLNNDIVANQLLVVMQRYVPTVNAPLLRAQIRDFLPYISKKLAEYNLPQDLKYIPIVESHFQLLTSKAGAKGFWQFMEGTARDYHLVIDQYRDEREDFEKSTDAACRLLRDYHKQLTRMWHTADWALVCAAYNFGNGNIMNAVRRHGTTDYFSMSLNKETALYVYKIIAVKELIERPELYLGKLNRNIFKEKPAAVAVAIKEEKVEIGVAKEIDDIELVAGLDEFEVAEITEEESEQQVYFKRLVRYTEAQIANNVSSASIEDGGLIEFITLSDMTYKGGGNSKGSVLTGKCYIIEDRIYFDMGRRYDIYFPDQNGKLDRGVPKDMIKKGLVVYIETER